MDPPSQDHGWTKIASFLRLLSSISLDTVCGLKRMASNLCPALIWTNLWERRSVSDIFGCRLSEEDRSLRSEANLEELFHTTQSPIRTPSAHPLIQEQGLFADHGTKTGMPISFWAELQLRRRWSGQVIKIVNEYRTIMPSCRSKNPAFLQ